MYPPRRKKLIVKNSFFDEMEGRIKRRSKDIFFVRRMSEVMEVIVKLINEVVSIFNVTRKDGFFDIEYFFGR